MNLRALHPLIPLPMATKIGMLIAILASIGLTYFFTMWSPLQEAIVLEQQQVDGQRKLLVKYQQLANDIPRKRAEHQQLLRQLTIALDMLPKKSQIPDLLEDVTAAGKEAGLSFLIFKPGPEKLYKIYAEVPVMLKISGSFRQLLTFLQRVGTMSRIVDIKALTLTTKNHDQLLNIQGQAITYRFIEVKEDANNKPQ